MLSCVWLLANSWTIAEQVPLSMGFFWQEYWSVSLVIQLYLTLWDPMDGSPPGSSVHGNSLGKNPGVGCYVLLQGILPTQGSNPGLQHCRQILQHPSHQESPKILERVTCLFQGIFLTQELNQGLLHCRQIFFFFLPDELPGEAKNTGEGCSSSRASSWPMDQNLVSYISCIDRQILYHWCHLGSPLV